MIDFIYPPLPDDFFQDDLVRETFIDPLDDFDIDDCPEDDFWEHDSSNMLF